MIEDGIYVSYKSSDEEKKETPRSVVVIKNAKVEIFVNPKNPEEDIQYLSSVKKMLKDAKSTSEYEDVAYSRLGSYWAWNGYTPNPSDFFKLDSDNAKKFIDISKDW
jgi:hypothetical protein